MYNLPYFKAKDPAYVLEFMRQHPFVVLAGCDENGHPLATHVPVLIEEREGKLFLLAHIMKQTDHHKAFGQNQEVLAIFSSAHSYVSASWYSDPKQASTWNYQAVHAKGRLRFLGDDKLLDVLQRLTFQFENNQSSPSHVENLPASYVSRLMKAIVAFEVEVYSLDHVFKLSQNRDEESYRNIVANLEVGDFEAKGVAAAMRANRQMKGSDKL